MEAEPTLEQLAKTVEELRQKLSKVEESSGGMLSSADFRINIIRNNLLQNKERFIKREWDEIESKRSFIIDPFDPINLTPYSYDLSIGDEAFSCRTEDKSSFPLEFEGSGKKPHEMKPGETIIVRTKEYIALPRCYSATVWPRFNFVREGIFQSMVKIDPTWYGQLGVALTNLSPATYPIWKGKKFATLVIYELRKDTDIILFKPHEILRGKNRKSIELEEFKDIVTDEVLRDLGLEDLCKIENDLLFVEAALKPEEYEKLLNISNIALWKKKIEDAIRIKAMGALGLEELDILIGKDQKGKRLERKDISEDRITEQELLQTAIEKGKPFNEISAIPELVMKRVENEFMPKIRAEVEAKLFPKMVTLMLTVLGFLSLIVAVAVFILDRFSVDSPLAGFDWPGTAVIVALIYVFGFIIIYTLYLLHGHRRKN